MVKSVFLRILAIFCFAVDVVFGVTISHISTELFVAIVLRRPNPSTGILVFLA